MVALSPRAMTEVKAIKDLQRAALQSVGLTVEDLLERQPEQHRSSYAGPTLVPRLSTILVLTPKRDNQFAVIRPAGPAPTTRTSTLPCSFEDVATILSFCEAEGQE